MEISHNTSGIIGVFKYFSILGRKPGLLYTLVFLLVTDLAILFDVPVLRQVLGLITVSVLPGLLIVFLLKLDRFGTAEKAVLIIGLSTAFVMFFGWIFSQVSFQLGHVEPLETHSLVLSLSSALAMLAIGAYIRNNNAFSAHSFHLDLNITSKLSLLLPAIFLPICILGTFYNNLFNNNVILLTLLFLIPVAVIIISIFHRKISEDTYPLGIILISATLLIMFWLRSEHIIGHDVHTEYFLFRTTLNNSHWSVLTDTWGLRTTENLDSCLSISVLPVIFQSLINLNGEELLFKGVYAIIFTFLPLAIYVLLKEYLGKLYAFFATLIFLSNVSFLFAPGSPRTTLAVFFVTLCIIVLFHSGITGVKRKLLFIIFGASTIVSHYTTSYIFLFLLMSGFLLSIVFRKYCLSRTITLTGIAFLAIMAFLWYSQVTQSPFESAVYFILDITSRLSLFGSEQARSLEIGMIMGEGIGGVFFKWITWGLTWLSFILIAVGVIGTLLKRKDMILAPMYEGSLPQFLQRKFDTEYLLLTTIACALMAGTVIPPYITSGYDPVRLYFLMTILLVVFFVIGTILLSKYLRVNTILFLLLLLILKFLFITGAIQEASGHHVKFILDSEAPAASYELVYDQEIHSASWLKEHMDENCMIHSSMPGHNKLISQGLIAPIAIDYWKLARHREIEGYIYLDYNSVINGELIFETGGPRDISEYFDVISGKNKLYSNGGSEIYK